MQDMRKKFKIIIVCCLVIILCCSCESEEIYKPLLGEISGWDEIKAHSDVLLYCDPNIVADTSLQIKGVIENNSMAECGFNSSNYILEQEQNGMWYSLSPNPSPDNNFSYTEIMQTCAAGKNTSVSFDLSKYGTHFEKGHYRIIFPNTLFWGLDIVSGSAIETDCWLVADFEIE